MRKQVCLSAGILLAAALGLFGCKSLTTSEQGWLSPKPLDVGSLQEVSADVLGQAPTSGSAGGYGYAAASDPFSSSQTQPIAPAVQVAPQQTQQPLQEQLVTAYQPFQPAPITPTAVHDPFLGAGSPVQPQVPPPAPVAVAAAPSAPTASVYGRAVAETPQQAANVDRTKDIPASGARPISDPFTGVQTIPSQYDTPETAAAWNNPWGIDSDSAVRNAVSIEEAAKKEEEEKERARLEELAQTKRNDKTPPYLKPLDKWNGPFETREQQNSIEREIIQQVSHVDVRKTYDNTPVYDWEKEEEKGFDWSVLDPVNMYTKIRDALGMGPDEKKANAAMKKGYDVLEQLKGKTPDPKDKSKWLMAAEHFMEAAKRWPNSVLQEDALHLAGECYFFGENFPKAMTSYQKLIIDYQHSKHIDNAVRRLFRIARYWEKEDQRGVSFTNMSRSNRTRPTYDTFGNAKKAYETIFMNDPNGPISDDAVMALATAFLAKGRYKGDSHFDQAAYYYKYLRENYPLSKHIIKAHEYEILARTNAYMGAEHSSSTLDEAGKLAEQTLRQFGGELESDSRNEVLTQKEEILQRKAEKEWVTGQFWDKKSYFGAARLQYEKILDLYPQTPYADKARMRMEQIKHKPDQPDKMEFIKKFYMPRGSI